MKKSFFLRKNFNVKRLKVKIDHGLKMCGIFLGISCTIDLVLDFQYIGPKT